VNELTISCSKFTQSWTAYTLSLLFLAPNANSLTSVKKSKYNFPIKFLQARQLAAFFCNMQSEQLIILAPLTGAAFGRPLPKKSTYENSQRLPS
jgi:hypothetical protein